MRMSWKDQVVHVKDANRIFVRKPKGKRPFRRLRVGGRIIFKLISETFSMKMWIGFMWLSTGTGGRLLLTR
jgi:hypothetical protein